MCEGWRVSLAHTPHTQCKFIFFPLLCLYYSSHVVAAGYSNFVYIEINEMSAEWQGMLIKSTFHSRFTSRHWHRHRRQRMQRHTQFVNTNKMCARSTDICMNVLWCTLCCAADNVNPSHIPIWFTSDRECTTRLQRSTANICRRKVGRKRRIKNELFYMALIHTQRDGRTHVQNVVQHPTTKYIVMVSELLHDRTMAKSSSLLNTKFLSFRSCAGISSIIIHMLSWLWAGASTLDSFGCIDSFSV